MANATIGALRVSLGLDSAAFTEGLSAAQKHLKGVGTRLQSIGASMATVGAGMSAAISAPLIAVGATAINEAVEMRDAVAQVTAGLTSMGDAAGRSLEQLTAQADKLANSSLFEDDQIMRGVTANMLTFGNIAGAQFDRAQQAAIDLATRMKMDLQPATLLVGKALNDPIKGMSALGRAGIQFTEDQKATIKSLVETGNAAGAQAIILKELERQFGGSAKAARDAAHPAERLRLAFASMAGEIGTVLLPVVDKVASFVSGLTERFGKLSPGMQKVVVIGGAVAAALGPILIVAGGVVAAIGAIIPVIAAIGAPLLAAAAAAAGVVAVFYLFRDDLMPIVSAWGEVLRETIGPKLAPLWEALKAAVTSIGAVFSQIFGSTSAEGITPLLMAWGTIVARIFGAAVDLITGTLNVITNLFKALGALLRGDFSAMWGYLWEAVKASVRSIANAFQTLFPEVTQWVKQTYEGVKTWLLDKFTGLVRQVGEKVAQVGEFFRGLWDKVVGHSYIPDMVKAIAEWMGPRLQDAMVDPARRAASETSAVFDDLGSSIDSTLAGIAKSISSKDWTGAISGVLGLMSGAGGWVGRIGKVGSAIMNLGASGSGTQLGEMVGVRDSKQLSGLELAVSPSPYFDVQVRKVARPMVDQGMRQAVRTSGSVAKRGAPAINSNFRRLGTT